MKPIKNYILFFIFPLVLLPCSGINPPDKEVHAVQDSAEIRQPEDYLLGGVVEAVCYSGFRKGQQPDRGDGAINPSYEEILEDMNILSKCGFSMIRLYDCSINSEMVLNVIRKNSLNMKVLLGIWLRAELSNHETCEWLHEPIPDQVLQQNKQLNLSEIEKGIELANAYPDIVIAVNVGNEALVDWNDHKVNSDTIIAYVKKVKQDISQQVTVADNYQWWTDHGAKLAQEVDFVSIHSYPVWEGKDINEGLSYTLENILKVQKRLPGVPLVITEAGWATTASEFGNRAGEEKQKQYYNEIMSWARESNITTFFFEAFDEDWKGDPGNPSGAEKHWGLFTVDRKPKLAGEHLLNKK